MNNNTCDQEEVGKRISARLAAEEVASLADDEAKTYGKIFWEQLHKIVCAHVPCNKPKPKPEKIRPMSQEEARVFGKQLVPFGEFSGRRVDDAPLDRLQWYADQTFTDNLRRYLESERIRMEG